jgi:hypothetical protein
MQAALIVPDRLSIQYYWENEQFDQTVSRNQHNSGKRFTNWLQPLLAGRCPS